MWTPYKYQTGELVGGFSYLKMGDGPQNLVIFPPLIDSLFKVTVFPLYMAMLFHRFADQYSTYIVSRRRNLPVGYSARDMADDYAEMFERNRLGQAHVIGLSLGGMIAQFFAGNYPQYVNKLVLVASAHKMGIEGLDIARKWIPWARRTRWDRIYNDSVDLTYSNSYQWIFQITKPWVKEFLRKKLHPDPSDFIISGQAAMIHDSSEVLDKIQKRTLIIAGDQDRFFPESLFYEMSRRIRNAELLMMPGFGHGIFEEKKKYCIQLAMAFLNDGNDIQSPANSFKPAFVA